MTSPPKGLSLQKASWILTPLLGLALFSTLFPGTWGSHLSPRFLQEAGRETGMSSFWGVLSDYRGFDLMSLAFLALGSALLCLLPVLSHLPQVPLRTRAVAGLGLCSLGAMVVLGLGIFTMVSGSNLLDYEPLTRFAPPEEARRLGAVLLAWGLFLCAAGAFLSFGTQDPKEVSRGN